MASQASWTVYHNGEYKAEEDVRISIFDRGFEYGDAGFDVTRTFNGRPFKVGEHVERLLDTLEYLRIDPGHSSEELEQVAWTVAERNEKLREPADDLWLWWMVSRGRNDWSRDVLLAGPPTVLVFMVPFPWRARGYAEGARLVTPSIRRMPPGSVDPKGKINNYANHILADLQAKSIDPEGWALMLDLADNVAEGPNFNFFLVKNGVIRTPGTRNVLGGIARATTIELARERELEIREGEVSLFDAYVADEAFVTSTSLCIMPVATINGKAIGGQVPGPVTQLLTRAWCELVELDIVEQALRHA